MGSTRYIMSMGELTRKDNSLCFRKNGKNVYIPVENTKEIFCFNEVSINTKLLDFLSQNNIIVHFFNYYGGYSGTYYPRDHYLSGKLLVKQVGKYNDDRMSIARLDQRISFLHEPSEGRFSLSLDISEVFKPVIVYRTIFDLVNNRKLQVEKHFDKNVNYCILNEDGRKIFVQAFEDRMESVFMHPLLKRKVSYRTALKLDCYKLIKSILEGKDFVPFSLKEGM